MPAPNTFSPTELMQSLRTACANARKLQQKLFEAEMLHAMSSAPGSGLDEPQLAKTVALLTAELEEMDVLVESVADECLKKVWGIVRGKSYTFLFSDNTSTTMTIRSARAAPFKDCMDMVLTGITPEGESEHVYLDPKCRIIPQAIDNVIDFEFHKARLLRSRKR
jgi:hypothetical protein